MQNLTNKIKVMARKIFTMKKQIVPGESTGREVSLEWSLHRILSADSKVRVTLQNSIIHSGRVEPPRDRKILMWTTSYSPPPQKNKKQSCLYKYF